MRSTLGNVKSPYGYQEINTNQKNSSHRQPFFNFIWFKRGASNCFSEGHRGHWFVVIDENSYNIIVVTLQVKKPVMKIFFPSTMDLKKVSGA